MKKTIARTIALAWQNDQGPWGKPSAQKPTPNKPRNPQQAPQQPELEDVLNQLTAQLRGFWRTQNGGNGGGNGSGNAPQNGLFGIGYEWLVLGAVGLWFTSGFYIIAPDQQGVVLQLGKYIKTTESGLNYHLPSPLESVIKVPVTRENIVEIGFRNSSSNLGGADVADESHMLTGDENIVDLDFTVRWKVADPKRFLFSVADPETTVAAAAEAVMRETIGMHPIDDALTNSRTQIQQAAQNHLQAVLDYYGAGVQVTGVELQKVNPPVEVIESFRDVQAARADAEKAINEAQAYANQVVPQARGQSSQITQAATAYKTSTIARAQGDASRFTAQLQAYNANPQVVRDRLYLDAMEQVLTDANKVVITGSSGALPFLPLDRLAPKNMSTKEGN